MRQEIVTVEQMAAIDAAAERAGIATQHLMLRAGQAVAAAIVQRFSPRPVTVLCGPGNNGGDGWAAAAILRAQGWPVRIEALAGPEQLGGAAGEAARAWRGEVHELGSGAPEAELYVDALFGAGLSRPLEGAAALYAGTLAPDRVVAVDVPSGIAGNSGEPLGAAHFRACLTVTFVRKKPAHVLMPGRNWCGETIVADIGAPDALVAEQAPALWENGPGLWAIPRPDPEVHKHARGHVVVASGGASRTGAARLAAMGALRGGAGLATVLSPPDAMAENAAHLTAIMLREAPNDSAYAEAARTADCLVVGPGFGTSDAHYKRLCAVIEATPRAPIVLDADAITLLAPLTHGLDGADVMTPHVGEFRRAFPGLWSNSDTRIDAARAAAGYARCVVLLKGPDTVIAAPDGRAIVNTVGTPYLATAGAGDVLAGLIAALVVQGLPSFEAAAAGAWLHGRAAEIFGPGLIAEDLQHIIPHVFKILDAASG